MQTQHPRLGVTTRRTFLGHSVTGLATASLMPMGARLFAASGTNLPAGTTTGGNLPAEDSAFQDPRTKLAGISSRAKQLWPVIYVDRKQTNDIARQDVAAALEGGADAVVLELGKDPAILAGAIEFVRKEFPAAKVGVNYLGGDEDPYGYITGFRIAKDYDLHIVWTDFCGVDLIKELPEISLHLIEAARATNAFYCSGVHMKYGTLLDPTKPLEKSAQQAMGWVDGVVITGPKTGVPTDPDRARRARAAVGSYPLGLASGVSAENFPTVGDYVDFCLVNTSISDPNHRIIAAKVRELRDVMGT